jgi:hypothetical protein
MLAVRLVNDDPLFGGNENRKSLQWLIENKVIGYIRVMGACMSSLEIDDV